MNAIFSSVVGSVAATTAQAPSAFNIPSADDGGSDKHPVSKVFRYAASVLDLELEPRLCVQLESDGVRIAIADAIDNNDLRTLGAACADLPLLIADYRLALGLPAAYAQRGWVTPDATVTALPAVGGHAAVLSGSCSTATNASAEALCASWGPGTMSPTA